MKEWELSKLPFKEQKDSMFNRHGDENGIQSFISSRLKQFSTFDVKTDGSLRVKRCTASQWANSDSIKQSKLEEVTSSNYIAI